MESNLATLNNNRYIDLVTMGKTALEMIPDDMKKQWGHLIALGVGGLILYAIKLENDAAMKAIENGCDYQGYLGSIVTHNIINN